MIESPEVVTYSDDSSDTSSESELVYIHLDEYEDAETNVADMKRIRIYSFEDEKRESELLDAISGLRKDYIMTTGVVFPSWVEGEIDNLGTETLNALTWVTALGERPEREDLEVIRKHLSQSETTND